MHPTNVGFFAVLFGVDTYNTTFKLMLALLLGGIVGVERERHNHPAGFRTHIILCVGSCLMMLLSYHITDVFNANRPPGFNGVSDPARIPAQVVSGVGFLGAGAIMRMGVNIRGLTTAANLWTMAGIGMAVGCGYYQGAVVATFILYGTLAILSRFEKILLKTKSLRSLTVTARDLPGVIGAIERALSREGVRLNSFHVSKGAPEGTIDIIASIEIPAETTPGRIVKELVSLKEIHEVDVQ